MKPRARRVTLVAAVLGAAVLGLAVILNWGTIRDHVEAWRFQLTRRVVTIVPGPGLETPPDFFEWILREPSRREVILVPGGRKDPATEAILQALRDLGGHVLEQYFPRRAYVVIPGAPP